MGQKFRIFIYHNGENLHLKLAGEFDGEAARELINILGAQGFSANKIFIHTNALDAVHPNGTAAFRKGLAEFAQPPSRLVFTGQHMLAA